MNSDMVKTGLQLLSKLKGKSYGGAAGEILMGLVAIGLGVLGLTMPDISQEASVAGITGGVALICNGYKSIGIRHAIQKAEDNK